MRRVLLVGSSGSGRTAVGSAVAERLGMPFLDDAALVERTTGTDPATLFTRDGEAAWLAAHASCLNLLLGFPPPLVGTVCSGVDLDQQGRDRLSSSGHVVWLRASAATLVRRVGKGAGRPWLGSDPAATLRSGVAERYPLYELVADQVVDVDVLPVNQIARGLVQALPADVTG